MSIRRAIAAVASGAVLASGLVATAATAAPTSIVGNGQVEFEPGRYIVTLVDPSAATYEGGINGFAPTKPDEGEALRPFQRAVQSYTDYLEDAQQDVADAAGVEIDYSYTLSLNGFAADLTVEQAAALAADRNVAAITPDELKHITAVPSTEFLGLDGDDGVWNAIGGVENAGKGVVVGVLDTGIAPENPAFAGDPLGTTPGDEPYRDGNAIVFQKADGSTFRGECVAGEQFTADDCNTKLITARYFVNGFGTDRLGDASTGEYVSPRDGDGHGSHTASTAAGNAGTPATVLGNDFGPMHGVAPAAKIAAYKVCWSGPDPTTTADDGCSTSDILAAIDQAVADGVDVINYSIGGGAAQTTISPIDEAFLGAAAAGIFVSASAGNDGPGASTLDNASPWITTVAASTIPSWEATVTLGDGTAMAGASITVTEEITGELVLAQDVALPDAADANLCLLGTLDPELTDGKIVVCERGVNARVEKSQEVGEKGGIGVVHVNVTPSSIDLDLHSVPTVHLDAQHHATVMAYAATEDATATLTPGNSTGVTPPTPIVAGFSSRGPVVADGSDLLKPDIAAPGVAILAATANAEGAEPTYAFLSGTSMAAPHIAGLAALYLGVSPHATPAEVKSAMMTTAYDTVDAAGNAVTDPFAQGAGHVDPTRFFEPGLLYLNGLEDWLGYIQGIGYDIGFDPIDPSNLNLASISVGALTAPEMVTRTVTSTQAGTFTASVSIPGIDAVVSPSTLTFGAAGETQSYTVTLARTDAPLDRFATGHLTWTSGETTVRSPLAVRPVTIVAPDEVTGEGVSGSLDVTVTPGGTGDIPLSTTGFAPGVLQPDPNGVETEHSGSGVTGDEFMYVVEVPAGTELARFDLDTLDDVSDLDLIVYELNADGVPVAGWISGTVTGDERIDLVAPNPATYVIFVSVYSADPAAVFDLRTFWVADGGAPLGLDPAVLAGVQGEPTDYTVSWDGLTENTHHLAIVRYADSGARTLVSVHAGDAPAPDAPVNVSVPVISGDPEVGERLTASPGEWDRDGLTFTYQWQADGVDIPGAKQNRYTVKRADQGKAITVVVTATAAGLPSTTATSEAVTVRWDTKTTLSLSSPIKLFSPVRATVTVTSGAADAAVGEVVLRHGNRVLATVPLTEADNGTVRHTLDVRPGIYLIQAEFVPSGDTFAGSTSGPRLLLVLF